jgi:NitT/TauT family transport system permease protein
MYQDIDIILPHAKVLLLEVGMGYTLGVGVGILLASIIATSSFLNPLLNLLIVASQSVPKVAFAPLVVMWLGLGIAPKVFFSAFVCLLPVVISTAKGMSSIDPDLLDYSSTKRLSPGQLFWNIRVPNCVPYLIDGMKIALPLSVIGAVVGELVLADAGLGYLVEVASSTFDTPLAFAAITAMSIMGMSMYALLCLVERAVAARMGRRY